MALSLIWIARYLRGERGEVGRVSWPANCCPTSKIMLYKCMPLQLLLESTLHYTARPPSTSMLIPVIKDDSSDAKNRHADATSVASQSRPRGTLARNFARFSGVSGTPEKASNLRYVSIYLRAQGYA